MSGGNIPTQELPTGILQVTVFDTHQNRWRKGFVLSIPMNMDLKYKLNLSAKSLKKRGQE